MAFPEPYKEISVSAPSDDYFIETLEFHHSVYSAPLRICDLDTNTNFTLESTAPVNPSTSVTFTALKFQIKKPKKGDQGKQLVTLLLPNVDRAIIQNLENARIAGGNILCYWRTYRASDFTTPIIDPPPYFEIKDGSFNPIEVSLRGEFFDFLNMPFPNALYTDDFSPGLVR